MTSWLFSCIHPPLSGTNHVSDTEAVQITHHEPFAGEKWAGKGIERSRRLCQHSLESRCKPSRGM